MAVNVLILTAAGLLCATGSGRAISGLLHTSCSAIADRIASMSECVRDPVFSKPRALLSGVSGIEFVEFECLDECCGFGGAFAVIEEEVSGLCVLWLSRFCWST
jgi:hypothetical protein